MRFRATWPLLRVTNKMTVKPKKTAKAAKHFGIWLMKYLHAHEITAKKLSDSTGFHQNVIQNWRSGRCQPNGYSVAVLATSLSQITKKERSHILDEMATALMWG